MTRTEARASTAVTEGGQLAGSFAGRLATVLNGTVRPPEAPSTDIIPLTTDISALPVPDGRRPHHQGRRGHTGPPPRHHDQLAHRRPAHPHRPARHPNRWVTQNPDHGFYDGLSGAVLHWKDGTFTPILDENGTASVAEAFTGTTDTGEGQLILSLRTRHPPTKTSSSTALWKPPGSTSPAPHPPDGAPQNPSTSPGTPAS